MPIKKIVTWVVVIFLVYYLVANPKNAAGDIHTLFTWIEGAAASLSTFVRNL